MSKSFAPALTFRPNKSVKGGGHAPSLLQCRAATYYLIREERRKCLGILHSKYPQIDKQQ